MYLICHEKIEKHKGRQTQINNLVNESDETFVFVKNKKRDLWIFLKTGKIERERWTVDRIIFMQ